MKTLKVSIASIIFLVLFFACNSRNTPSESIMESDQALEEVIRPEVSYKKTQDDNKTETIEQKIIKKGHVRFETQSLDNTYKFIKALMVKYDGYIQNDNSVDYGQTLERTLSIRVPSKAFQPLIDTLDTHVTTFDEKNISRQDVTEEYIDLEARLKAKRQLELRYLELLKKANSIKDMLEIERQLALIREDIESQQGRLRYLNNRVAFSTLNITFYETTKEVKAPSQRFINRLGRSLVTGFNWLGEFIIIH